jgi:(p)ppGpp synthase/HD superfamily hydrolase
MLTGDALTTTAQRIAADAHAGQTDKAGRPYLAHPARVAATVAAEGHPAQVVAAAWLHDVLEDSSTTAEDLLAAGIPPAVVRAVEALTHAPHEPRTAYLTRVKANLIACHVKAADLADNTDPARLAVLDVSTQTRLRAKYAAAYRALGLPVPVHLEG